MRKPCKAHKNCRNPCKWRIWRDLHDIRNQDSLNVIYGSTGKQWLMSNAKFVWVSKMVFGRWMYRYDLRFWHTYLVVLLKTQRAYECTQWGKIRSNQIWFSFVRKLRVYMIRLTHTTHPRQVSVTKELLELISDKSSRWLAIISFLNTFIVTSIPLTVKILCYEIEFTSWPGPVVFLRFNSFAIPFSIVCSTGFLS